MNRVPKSLILTEYTNFTSLDQFQLYLILFQPVAIHDGPYTTNTLASKKITANLHYNQMGFHIGSPIRKFFLWKIVENNISPFLRFLPLQVPYNTRGLDCYIDSEFVKLLIM